MSLQIAALICTYNPLQLKINKCNLTKDIITLPDYFMFILYEIIFLIITIVI